MFDFFKNVYFEMNDFDMEMLREERNRKIEENKKLIFDKKAKVIIIFTGVLFLIFHILFLAKSISDASIGVAVKSFFSILMVLVTVICVCIPDKKFQVTGLFGIFAVVIFSLIVF